MDDTAFTYTTYIAATADDVWRALTHDEVIAAYFGGSGPRSDWRPGSRVEWKIDADGEYHDWGQRVLAAEPGHFLSYTWHNYEPEMAAYFPEWTGTRLAELRKEPVSTADFTITSGPSTRLDLRQHGFAPGSEMRRGISEGWPMILSNLKTVLETGKPMPE